MFIFNHRTQKKLFASGKTLHGCGNVFSRCFIPQRSEYEQPAEVTWDIPEMGGTKTRVFPMTQLQSG